jgi:ADP-ribose pyrophosphatase
VNWRRRASASLSLGPAAVGVDSLDRPDGERVRRAWLDPPDAVAVVAVRDGDLVMVEQYRPRLDERFLACPAGRVDPGESFAEAGRRELREETGYRADDVELLREYYPEANLRKRRGVVVADGLTPGERDTDEGEFVEPREVPVEDALDAAREGPLGGWTLAPILLAREEGRL